MFTSKLESQTLRSCWNIWNGQSR